MNNTHKSEVFPEDFTARLTPEQILWLEVIHSAYHDVQHFWESGARCPVKLYYAHAAKKWIFSPTSKHKRTSFLWCCEAVFDDPTHCIAYVRSKCTRSLPNYMQFLRKIEAQKKEAQRILQVHIANQIQLAQQLDHPTQQIISPANSFSTCVC